MSGLRIPRPELVPVCRVWVELGPPIELGDVDGLRRRTIPIVGGHVRGDRLRGTVLDGGADWQTVDAHGTAGIDTRYTLRTDDGDLVAIATTGVRRGPPDVLARLSDPDQHVDPATYYFRITARLWTGARHLRWLTDTVFVAAAAREAHQVVYDLYEVL